MVSALVSMLEFGDAQLRDVVATREKKRETDLIHSSREKKK